MAFVSIYFSLGSNLGNRERNIEEALHRMDEAFEGHYTALSRLIETKPMGFSGGKFLNAVALYRTFRPEIPAEDAAKDVLSKVKSIERAMGRTDPPEYDGAGATASTTPASSTSTFFSTAPSTSPLPT